MPFFPLSRRRSSRCCSSGTPPTLQRAGWGPSFEDFRLYGCQFALQVGRIVREEQLLSADEGYRTYKGRVRYRVIPGVF
ncbi:hypothetical protein [Paraburkholderia xenovorans]|jgi:hypothetical protein|uniref:hypothetical protein n=1 Tax=Paraburkholderia xenovorans TaxID=36873 RepID=UPI000324A4FC